MRKKPFGRGCHLIALVLLAGLASPAIAQPAPTVVEGVPAARDVAWPGGTMSLDVDASDITQRIVRIRQTIPLTPAALEPGGRLTLLLPQWLPGQHGPRGEIEKLAGLTVTADGRPVAWSRDPVNVYAFHLTLPEGARTLVAQFQYLASTEADQGRIKIGTNVMNLQWENLSLYPAGYAVARIPVQARVTYPAGWQAATALRGKASGNSTAYEATDYGTLIDSPVFAGASVKSIDLGQSVTLNLFADDARELVATPDQVERHRKLVAEALALFGARHFDRYDFLLSIGADIGRIGLEHHRSSENAVESGYFLRWNDGPGDRNILPHELVHSWNGKFRRPAGLATPDYATPMRDELLWVYEGQTQFWGYVLGARSGIYTVPQTLDALALIAARLDAARGRDWRPVADTVYDPIVSARRPKGWDSWQRNEDYYNEGLMVWLEADALIRRGTGGKRGLDDFARAFFGMRDGDWAVLPYTRADVVKALSDIYPYDWDGFFTARIDGLNHEVGKAGLELGGYRLVYGEIPNNTLRQRENDRKLLDQSFGIGLVVRDDGLIDDVVWDSPAFKAGLKSGDRILAVAGIEYARERMTAGLRATATGTPLEILVKQGRRYTTIRLAYSGGIRYPRLQKIGEGESGLDRLLKPRT